MNGYPSQSLAELTTIGVGGMAKHFAHCTDSQSVLQALSFARENDLPVCVMGGGSNLIVNDNGFDGLVIKFALSAQNIEQNINLLYEIDGVVVRVSAALSLDQFVDYCCQREIAGIERLSGIPGTVGGAVVQNAGAYGQSMDLVVDTILAVDTQTLERVEIPSYDLGFGYRTTALKNVWPQRYIVTEVTFTLSHFSPAKNREQRALTSYQGLKDPAIESILDVREAILKIRAQKGMIVDATSENNYQSCGSFFKNPIVDSCFAGRLKSRSIWLFDGEEMPAYQQQDDTKLAAAWLIEKAGFERGFSRGKVGLSPKHALAIINRGGATCAEILALADDIAAAVRHTFDVELAREVSYLTPKGIEVPPQPKTMGC